MQGDNVSIREFQEILRADSNDHGLIEALRRLLQVSEPSQWVSNDPVGMSWVGW